MVSVHDLRSGERKKADRDLLDREQLKHEFEHRLEALDQQVPADFVKEFGKFAADIGADVGDALLDAYPELFAHAGDLTRRFEEFVIEGEIEEAQFILGLKLEAPISFKEVASGRAVNLYDRVNELFDYVDFRKCRQVVIVGCGRRPFTMFHIHDRTDVSEIIGLDIVPEAIETANALAERLGYDRFRFSLSDGRAYDFADADFVYVASMVSPKAAVVTRIVDTASSDVHITVREPYSLGRLWSESAVRPLDPRVEIIDCGEGSATLSRDVHLKRRA